jgi:hypothetical protein
MKYYYDPIDNLVVFSDGRKFSIDSYGNIFEFHEPFELYESYIPCKTSTEAFQLLIGEYGKLLAEELELKRRELVNLENEQLKSLLKLRKEVEKYESNLL